MEIIMRDVAREIENEQENAELVQNLVNLVIKLEFGLTFGDDIGFDDRGLECFLDEGVALLSSIGCDNGVDKLVSALLRGRPQPKLVRAWDYA